MLVQSNAAVRATQRRFRRLRSSDGAVSSVIGTILMVAVTVTVFAGVSIVVLGEFGESGSTNSAKLRAEQGEGTLVLSHEGGDPMELSDGYVSMSVNGVPTVIQFADVRIAGQTASGSQWAIGDNVCVIGAAAQCIYPLGTTFTDLQVVYANTLILTGATGASGGGGGPGPGLLPDLVPSNLGVTNATSAGANAVVSVRVSNAGTLTLAGATDAALLVDGLEVSRQAIPVPMAAGANATMQFNWVAEAGAHTILIALDPDATVLEGDETNNNASIPVNVSAGIADPGQAYLDANGDQLYQGSETLLADAEIRDGTYNAATGLVIPASVAPIDAASINFVAAGPLLIATDLTGDGLILEGTNVFLDGITLDQDSTGGTLEITATGNLSLVATEVDSKGPATLDATGAIDATNSIVDLTSNDDALEFLADGNFGAAGAQWTTNGQITVEGNAVSMAGITVLVERTGWGMTVDALGNTDLSNSDMDVRDDLDIQAPAGTMNLDGAELRSRQGDVVAVARNALSASATSIQSDQDALIYSSQGALTAPDLAINAGGYGYAYSSGAAALDRIAIDAGGVALVQSVQSTLSVVDGLVDGQDGSYTFANGDLAAQRMEGTSDEITHIQSTSGNVDATDATAFSADAAVYIRALAAGKTVIVSGADVDAETSLDVYAGGDVTAINANLDSKELASVRSSTGSIDISGTYLEGHTGATVSTTSGLLTKATGSTVFSKNGGTTISSTQTVDVQSIEIRAKNGININLNDASDSVLLDQGKFLKQNGGATTGIISPNGVTVTGTLTKGSWSY